MGRQFEPNAKPATDGSLTRFYDRTGRILLLGAEYAKCTPDHFTPEMFVWYPTTQPIPTTYLLFLWSGSADRVANALERLLNTHPVITCPYKG